MAVDNSFMIRKFDTYEKLYVLYNQPMNVPFMECDDETFDDQVYAFTKQEEAQVWARPFIKDKYALIIREIPGKLLKAWLLTVASLGVNAVMIQDEGAPVRVQIKQLITLPDFEKAREAKIPEANPELQLTMIYFMQQVHRPIERGKAENQELVRLEEEMAHNLMHSRLIVSFDTTNIKGEWNPADPTQKAGIPLIKTKNGTVYQPVYTEVQEFRKFNMKNPGRTMRLAAVPFTKLPTFLIKESQGMVINPGGFNYIMNRQIIENLIKRYGNID